MANGPEQQDAADTDGERHEIQRVEMRQQRPSPGKWIGRLCSGNAGEGVQLADDNQECGGVDEASDDRVAQQVDHPTHLCEA